MSERTRRRERGASSAEYVGAVVVAAILVGAIVFTVSPQGANVRAAVCDSVGSILQTELGCGSGDEGGDEAGPPTDEDFQPPVCQVSRTGEEYNSTISIAFIDIGDNAGLVRTVMSDGTVTLTATDGAMLGASGGAGAELRTGGGAELGASVDFGGGVELGLGDTWTFPDAESADEFEELLNDHRVRDVTRTYGGRGAFMVDLIDPLDPLPEPGTTTTEIGLTGEVDGQLGINLTGNDDGSGPSLQAQAIAASVEADATWTQTTDTNGTEGAQDDSTTYTVDMSINPDVSSDIWSADLGLGDTEGMSMSITENAAGEITEISIVSTSEGAINAGATIDGGGSDGTGPEADSGSGSIFTSETDTTATVATTSLSLDPDSPGYDEDVSVVQDWLGGQDSGGYEWPGTIPMGAVNPARAGSDSFSRLMHEQATVSAITSEGVTSASGLAAEVSLGLKLGFDFSVSESEAEAVYAAYLGAPRNAERSMVPYEDCIS
ncbi:hypothetical protein [Janibacter alittae]|uniref:Uncharacterized protein n=1 Tax=Janibacter alittae TaxID=3115209 RepID=A0ABZ2MH74_9MICO